MSCERTNLVIPSTLLVRLDDGVPVEIPLEEYVKGALAAHLQSEAPPEALKALSIAIRSLAAVSRQHARDGFDLCSGGDCAGWRPQGRSTASDAAADETAGQVLVVSRAGGDSSAAGQTQHRGAMRIASSPFFDRCDGHTRSSQEAWHLPIGHCLGVACSCGGTELQGHGVGLCLSGALAMARRGASALEILKHYYTGAEAATATAVPRGRLCQSLVLGRVVDSAGRPRSGITLVLSGPAGPFRRAVSGNGRFWFSGLPTGDWDLKVQGSSIHRAGLHTDGRGTLEVQLTIPGLPALQIEAVALAHPRLLIGTLGYGGVPVTITGPSGSQATVESGSTPEFDPGGFIAPLPPPGTCTIAVLDQRFTVEIGDTGLWLRFTAQATADSGPATTESSPASMGSS